MHHICMFSNFLSAYRVGSRCGWSDLFSFVALAPRPDGSFKYAFYGDMGSKNAESVGKLQNEAQNGDFDMVLHIGRPRGR